jgi:hypothetical protein
LPDAATKALHEISTAPSDERSDLASLALEAVGFPSAAQGTPLASELDEAQRAVATALAPMRDVWLGQWAIPQPTWSRLRWLGLAPPGVLDLPVKAPLWRKLHESGKDLAARAKAFSKLDLPLLGRLEAYADIALGGYRGLHATWTAFDELRGPEVGAWAKRQAERVTAAKASHENDKILHTRQSFSLAVMIGLARAQVPFEEKWSVIVDPFDGPLRLRVEALKGIAEPLRSKILAERVEKNPYSGAAIAGLELLTHFPSAALTKAILAKSDRASKSKAFIVSAVAKVAAKHDAVDAVLAAFKGKQPRPLTLAIARTHVPKRAADLTGVRREQVNAVLAAWDDDHKSLDERFADEGLPGGLMIREVVVAANKKQPAYDAVSFNADDGLVFTAGTTDVVAHLVQHEVQCDDERLHDALRETLCLGGGTAKKLVAKKKSVAKKKVASRPKPK